MAYTYGSNTYCTINGSSAKAYQMRVGYELVSQDIESNTSKLNVIVQVRVINDAYETYGFKQTTIINGQTLTAQTFSVRTVNTWVTFGTKQITVSHQDNGDYSESISASFTTTAPDTYTLKSGSASVKPTLASIPRATTPTVAKTNISFNDSITISTPRASTSFTHKLYFKIGTSAKTMIANGSTQANAVTTSFTWSDIKYLMNWVSDAISGTLIIYCQTYNGETYIGEKSISLTVTVPDDILPSVSLSVSEYVNEVAEKIGKYLKGKSRLNISTTASGNYASTIKSYKITIGNNETYTEASVVSNVLISTGDITITATVTDSRGRSKSDTKTITVYDYIAPYVSILRASRCNSDGTENRSGQYANLLIKAGVTEIENNTATYQVGYKLRDADEYEYQTLDITAFTLNDTITLDTVFNIDLTYDIILKVTDVFGAKSSKVALLETDFVLWDNYKDGTGLAFGKVAEKPNAIELGMKAYDECDTVLTNGLCVYDNNELDANTTLEHSIITAKNTPISGAFYIVNTYFYSSKAVSSNRAQFAIPYYVNSKGVYYRYYYNGVWSAWVRLYDSANESLNGNINGYAQKLNLGRTANTVDTLDSTSRFTVREHKNDDENLPTAHFYHVFNCQSVDADYTTQLAIGMTTDKIFYRKREAGTWDIWREIQTYAVGTIVCTGKNSPPSPVGTWELIDKEFTPQMLTGTFSLNTTNCTSCAVDATIAGHSIALKFSLVNKVAIADTALAMGTLNPESLGVSAFPLVMSTIIGASDGGNAWSAWTMGTGGNLSSVDCDPSNTSVGTGQTTLFYMNFVIADISTMLDSFCNKFYWKRIA